MQRISSMFTRERNNKQHKNKKNKNKNNKTRTDTKRNSVEYPLGLGLSNIEGTPAPPDFDIDKSNDIMSNKDNTNPEIVKSIKEGLQDMKQHESGTSNAVDSSDSELNFPTRTDSKKGNELESKTKVETKSLEEDLEVEVMKMKIEDSYMVSEGMNRFNFNNMDLSTIHTRMEQHAVKPHEKYVEKLEKLDPSKPIIYDMDTSKPVELYIETIESIFDQQGNIFSRSGQVKYLGVAEFNPARHKEIQEKNSKKARKAIELKSDLHMPGDSMLDLEEKMIVEEIRRFEKQQAENSATYKPGKYFYKGRQIFPEVLPKNKMIGSTSDIGSKVSNRSFVSKN